VQKILEQTLLGEALMSAPIAASVFDDERNYVAVNDAFCTLTQYQRAEPTALKAGTKLAPDKEAREAIAKALRGHGAVGQVKPQAQGRNHRPNLLLGNEDHSVTPALLPPPLIAGRRVPLAHRPS
jgi:hypothetical protein